MLYTRRLATVLISLWLSVYSVAQSSNDSCGADITARKQYYEIKFFTYCQTRISSVGNFSQIKRTTFKDCSAACVSKGKLCGGFAFDRDSHFSIDNCYLLSPTDRWQTGSPSENIYFDSASIDNSSLPLTRSDCLTTGENRVYGGYDLHCGQRIPGGGDSTQLGAVFASSISDCLNHCKNLTLPGGTPLCEAVTWDPTVLYGYENCYMIGHGYIQPTYDAMWDSATLVGTTGRPQPNSTSNTTSTPSPTASNKPESKPSSGLSSAGIAGVVVCSLAAVAILIGTIVWYYMRRKKRAAAEAARFETAVPETAQSDTSASTPVFTGLAAKTNEAVNVHEIADGPRNPVFEADSSHMINEAGGNRIYERP